MGQRLVRVIRVLRALEAAKPVTIDALAEELGISRRTVFRDLDALRKAGFRIDFNHKRSVYRMHIDSPQQVEEPSSRDLVELLLQAAATSLPQTNDQRRRARQAANLLVAGLSTDLIRTYVAMRDSVRTAEPASNAIASRKKIDLILDALANESGLTLLSLNPSKKAGQDSWVVKPLQIVRDGDRWIIEAITMPTGAKLRADLAKVGVEPSDSEPPAEDWSDGQEPGSWIEIL